ALDTGAVGRRRQPFETLEPRRGGRGVPASRAGRVVDRALPANEIGQPLHIRQGLHRGWPAPDRLLELGATDGRELLEAHEVVEEILNLRDLVAGWPRPGQDLHCTSAFGGARGTQRVQEDQRAFAFPQVAADLIAVLLWIGPHVEPVVGDLEGDAQLAPEGYQLVHLLVGSTRGDRADLHGLDDAVPIGSLSDNVDVLRV